MKKLIATLLLCLTIPALGLAQDLSYKNFKTDVPLMIDPYRIAVFDESPGAQALRAFLERQGMGTRMDGTSGPWTLLDLSGGPSAGNPLMLIQEIAEDPASTLFAAPMFLSPDGTDVSMLTGRTVNVRFKEGVPLSVVMMELQNVGLGLIVEENWQGRANLFRVAAGSRSGIDMLTAANLLAVLDDVIYAVPAFRIFGQGLITDDPALLEPVVPVSTARGPGPRLHQAPMTPADQATTPAFTPSRIISKDAAVCTILVNPGDPLLPESWGLDQPSDIDIDGPEAWAQCSGSETVRVILYDDGTDSHPDLPDVILGGDFTDICNGFPCAGEAPPDGCSKHGTAVLGSLAAIGGNGEGSLGAAPGIQVVSIRVGTYDTSGGSCIWNIKPEWLAAGISRGVELGGRVSTLSWNWPRNWDMPDVIDAYEYAYAAGMVNFNSAGNTNQSEIMSPGDIPEVNSISGLDILGNRFDQSHWFGSSFGPLVAFAAPAQDILTTDLTGTRGYSDGSPEDIHGPNYTTLTGTFFACPKVAGIAALILSCRPDLSPMDVEFILRITAQDCGAVGKDDVCGYGLPKGGAAVETARGLIFQDGFESGTTSRWQ